MALVFLLLPAGPAFAATINVDATCTLAQAINEANEATTSVGSCEAGTDGSGATGADTINITADITLSAELPQIASTITINGNGRTISGADTHNIFDVRFTTGDLTVNNLILTNGFESQGGAITAAGDVTLNEVVIKNSRAHEHGGALYMSNSQADLVVNRSAFHNNRSTTQGGGAMLLNGKTHKITNSTFYNNTITGGRYGAAIYLGLNRSTATFELNHVTITSNSGGVSALAVNRGALTMRNSIVYGNAVPDCVRDVDNGSLTVNSGNIHTLSAPAAAILVNCGTPFSTADPLLSSSATGSPPYFTIAANSPAVDGATCITGDNPVTVDQRGTTRPQGSSCDIGAFEYVPPPNASFTAEVDTGNVLLWNFDASGSSGPITSYAWTFGDGNSGTGETTTHTYSSGGSYTVTLTATGPGGSDSATQSISIPKPVASFTAAVDTGNVLLWNFDASGSSGPITSYAWTFGDGNSGTGETTTHTYSSFGSSYTVTLTATGPGGSDSAMQSISTGCGIPTGQAGGQNQPIAGGTYTLTSDCRQLGPLTTGGATSDIIIRGNGHTIYPAAGKLFIQVRYNTGGTLIMEDVTIDHETGGDEALTMIFVHTRESATEPIELLRLTDVTLQNHQGAGAIWITDLSDRAQNTQTVTLTRVTIRDILNPVDDPDYVRAYGVISLGNHIEVNVSDSRFINIQSLDRAPLYAFDNSVINVSNSVFRDNEAAANILARDGGTVNIGDGISFSGLCGRGVTVPYSTVRLDVETDDYPGTVNADFSARPCPRPRTGREAPPATPTPLPIPSAPGADAFGPIGSGAWRNHFARLGIQAANAAKQTEWARGDASVSGANVCLWEYECSTDGHWAYGHYHATHGHNYQAPGTRPPAAVNRSPGGAFNLCYSVWSGGCNSAEAWQFGHASGKQIYERWLYGRQLQAAPSGY